MTVVIWIIILALAVLITGVAVFIFTRRKDVAKVNYLLDALEDGEMNFRFQDKTLYNRVLNRLRNIFEKQRVKNEQESWSKLLRIMTHEIMNTLTPIISISETLSQSIRRGEEDKEHLADGIDIIYEASTNMRSFINNYRQLSGLSNPKKKETNLYELVNKVLTLKSEDLQQASAVCESNINDVTLTVKIDEAQVQQVLINLLMNAVQAGAKNIRLDAKKIENTGTVITVSNDGEPINPETQEMIFVPFFTTKPEGTGIGLSICRNIVQKHQGKLNLLRSNTRETVFEIIFP